MEKQRIDNEEIDLRGVFEVLWKKKRLIIGGTIICTTLAILIAFLLPKTYQSDAVLSLSATNTIHKKIAIFDTNKGEVHINIENQNVSIIRGLDIPAYRSFSNVFQNVNLFNNFLEKSNYQESWKILPDFFDENVEIIYSYDEKAKTGSIGNSVLGIRLKCEAPASSEAKKRVTLLGNYLKTTILNVKIWSYYNAVKNDFQKNISQNKKAIMLIEFEIAGQKEKEFLIENELLKMPAIGVGFNRQIVQVSEETEKYLSPQQQLVSVKVSIKNNEVEMRKMEREVKTNQILLEFIDKISDYFPKNTNFLIDDRLLENINKEKDSFFSAKDKTESKEAFYTIDEKFTEFLGLKDGVYKFVSGPTLPKDPIKPDKLIIVIASFIMALFFFILLALIRE